MNIELAPGQHPIDLFLEWVAQARAAGARRPLVMALATALDGAPAVRMVMARAADRDGIVFYSSALSRKGIVLAFNPRAAVSFYWAETSRSVRVSGNVEKLPRAETEVFFRGYAPQIQRVMRVSTQSAPYRDRRDLEQLLAADAQEYPDGGPVPVDFTGYRIMPASFEFWSEADDGLHDHVRFERSGAGWSSMRLQP